MFLLTLPPLLVSPACSDSLLRVVRGGLTGDEMGLPELFAREPAAASLEQQQEDSVGTLGLP